MPYRIAAPPAPELPEAEEPYAAVLRAQRRRARFVSVAILVFLAGGLGKVARSAQKPRERHTTTEAARIDVARTAIASARQRAYAAQVRFERGIREAVARDLRPRPELGACPVALPAASSPVYGRPLFPLLTIERGETELGLPSQAVGAVLADVRRAEAHIVSGRFEEAALYARALDRPERFGYDVVLVADSMKPPRARGAGEYDPGEIAGRAFVFDFASGAVVCAGDVRATSSRSLGYTFSARTDAPARLGALASMGDAIREDIRQQTERAILESVRWRAGPP